MTSVTIYSTDSCPWCRKAEEYLEHNNISFNLKKVDNDRDAAVEMVQKSGQQGVPVLDIDGKIIVGFNKPEIDSSLGL
ncbi:MAG: glutaredoxin family protein [Candidatus Nanoarchaeia archaeon]